MAGTTKKTTASTSATKGAAKSTAKKTTAKRSATTKAGARKTATTKAAASKTTRTSPARPAKKTSGSVAAAADRAGGERARRRSTPLLTGPSAEAVAAVETGTAESSRSGTTATSTRPTTSKSTRTTKGAKATRGAPAKSTKAAKSTKEGRAGRPTKPALRVVPDPDGTPPTAQVTGASRPRRRPSAARTGPTAVPSAPAASAAADGDAGRRTPDSGQTVAPGVAELLSILLSSGQLASRTLGQAAGAAAGEDWERRFAETLEFLRRRVTGDYRVDDFGFDEDFTTHTAFPVLRLLKDKWFRVEVRGIENIPDDGGALVVSNHSGTVAMDSVITQLAIHDSHPRSRFLRMLGADLVFQMPFVGDFARKTGATLATNPDAERLMRSGELVGVWPEGFKGVGKPFRERYKLQRFGRGGFVSAAIRSEVPIIPCSVVGAEEIYPMIGNMKTVARLIGAPYAPITPTFPLLGPLGLIPLPSRWIIEFGPPIDTASLGPAAADDPMLVFDLTDQVRETIQQTLYSVLVTRRSVFF